jgi:TnpA family transposase
MAASTNALGKGASQLGLAALLGVQANQALQSAGRAHFASPEAEAEFHAMLADRDRERDPA